MDIELLAETLTILARQAAPHLREWGGKATEAALESLAGEKAKQAGEALGWLKPKLEEKPIAEAALQELADPELDEEDAVEAEKTLERQLLKLLERNRELQAELLKRLNGVEVRAGRRGIAVGRDLQARWVITAETVNFFPDETTPSGPPAAEDEARDSYLRQVMERTGFVMLSGVDPALGGDHERRLHLKAVYTALSTRTPRRQIEAGEDPEALRRKTASGEERPLSALEQLDRHPRLVLLGDPGSGKSTLVAFVALCLAGEGRPGVEGPGVESMTSPLPKDDGSDADERQPWSHGALLPVRVILRDFAARGLPADVERPTAEHLRKFLESELREGPQGAFVPALIRALDRGKALVLLDGLDEVPEASRRRKLICEAVMSFVEAYGESRFVVTSRTYAYQKQDFHLPGFEVAELAPFGDGQVRRFARRWYAGVAGLKGLLQEEAQKRAADLEREIFASVRLRELAARPLLLTLMASLHAFRGGSLPDKREKLYEETVELLLDVWEQQQRRHEVGREVIEPSLLEYLKVEREDVLRMLQKLAYEVHGGQPELEGTADVTVGHLVGELMKLRAKSAGRDVDPGKLADYLSQRSGILEEREPEIYTFPHRTVQEYLAARHLFDAGVDYDRIAATGREDPNRWREVIVLAAIRFGPLGVLELAEALAFEDASREPAANAWGLHLAGQALSDVVNLADMSPRNQDRLEKLRHRLVELLGSEHLPAHERALAGDHLARLGDPRFDEGSFFLPADPAFGFLPVPGGEHVIGSDPEQDPDAFDDEQPQHKVKLSPFWLARWPVTVAQFRAFVEAADVEIGDRRALTGLANRPVVRVSWDEARAYCEWLTERLREVAPERVGTASGPEAERLWSGLASGEIRARLPTESEWEAAARGRDARLYPWGDPPPTAEHANFGKTSATTPVGIYPLGRGPWGGEDQAGNVWEWCADVSDEGAYAQRQETTLSDPRSEEGDTTRRVLRGGAWGSPPLVLRAAYRSWLWHWSRFPDFGFRVVCGSGPEHD